MIKPPNQHQTKLMRQKNLNNLINYIKKKVKNNKPSTWNCTCGYTIPKKGANLSGGPQYKQDYHIHCPNCGRTVAQFINPKETQ